MNRTKVYVGEPAPVDIDRQIAELGMLRNELSQLRVAFDSTRPVASCEILKQLSDPPGVHTGTRT